ncbi:hypothetical protein DL770_000996 [Monosporascus sp. CRB-9-2]|nr:hypothetical protein DL770_000996 [Monosporascus sp. CRB-9-2]
MGEADMWPLFEPQVHPWLLALEDSILRTVAEPPHLSGAEKRPAGGRFWVRVLGSATHYAISAAERQSKQ